MAEPTAEETARKLREKFAASRQPAATPASAPPVEDIDTTARKLREKYAARAGTAAIAQPRPSQTLALPDGDRATTSVPPPKAPSKKTTAPPPAPKPRTLDERVAADDAAYWKSPTGQKEAQDVVLKRFGADRPLSVKEATRDLAAQRDGLPDAIVAENRLQTEGARELADTFDTLGKQGLNAARIAAGGKVLNALGDRRTVGAAANTGALNPARTAVKQELADAERDFSLASERARNEAEAKRRAAEVDAAPGDLTAARRLADALRADTKKVKGQDTSLAKQYVDKRVIELENTWRVDREKDPAKVAEARKKAQDQALAELVALNTQDGYAIPIGRDLLFDSDSAWTALLPAREVLSSGKVARGESLPGWFLNTILGAPDYAVTTIAEAMNEDKDLSLADLTKNVGDRRDLLTYAIEKDPALQADIASGDVHRVNRAILKLAPMAVLELATPDAVSFAEAYKLPGGAMKAARVAQEAGRLMRAEEKLSPVLALQRAAHAVEAAEEATRAAKKAAKAEAASRKTLGAVADAVERGDALDALPEAAAVRIRDDIAARLSVYPEVQRFLDDTGAAGRPLTPEVADLPTSRRLDDPLREVSERGRAKYTAALAEAEKAAREDFVKQARLAPDEALDATKVVDVGADDARKAAIAAEEERLRKTRALADEQRAVPDERVATEAERARRADEAAQATAQLREAETAAKKLDAEAAKFGDGTHPALQKMRKAADEAADAPLPAFLRRERARIEKALAKLDEGTAARAAPTYPSTLQKQIDHLNAEQAILDANRGLGAEPRARRQAVLDKRRAGLERQKAAVPAPPPPAPTAAQAKRRAKLDEDMRALMVQEDYLRRTQGAEAHEALRAAREEARAELERIELEQERAAKKASEAAETLQRVRGTHAAEPLPKMRTHNPERLAALEAQIAKREGRIAGMQEVPTRELFGARTFDSLVHEIAQINRDLDTARKMTPANLRARVKRFGSDLAENLWDYFHPAREREHKSLGPAWRALVRDFEGELKGVNERLAAAFASVNLKADDWNTGARTVLVDYEEPFRESIRGGGIDGAYLGSAATAYLRDPALLDANSIRLLTDVVVRWAREDGADLDVLRAELRSVSEKMGIPLRAAQEGDVMLANAVASQGAAHRLLVSADARGITLGKDEARAANTYLDNLGGVGAVGGRVEASKGRQVMAGLLVPEDYRRGLGLGGQADDLKKPLVPARTEQARGVAKTKAQRAEEKLRQAAVASMSTVMENTEEVLGSNVFVPRAVRDALAKQVDAVIATARIHDEGRTLLALNFWKQAAVLGVVFSQPNQTVMDFWGDVLAVNARLGPVSAAKVAGRSIVAQFLATRGVAQGTRLIDVLRGAEAGTTARQLVQRLSLTPEIDAIFNRDPTARIGKHTALEVHDVFRREGVFESFSSGQLTRTVQEAAYLIYGDTPFGKAKALYFENQRALQDMANLSATRRRLAIGYGLVETGHTPEEAARIAVEIAGDFAGELHPVERGWFSVAFPFWSYRKFNARRTLKSLASPFWLTRGMKAQAGAAAALSWYLDDSDEYGFHTDSMHDEPDPEALDRLRAAVHRDHPELDMASAEAEALVADLEPSLPRAIERYNRLVAKLRAMPYDEAKKAWTTDPEWRWLAMYHAEDPVRGMVPGYAQDRYAVFVQENRSQAVESWYNKGVGRFERDPNEQRYWLMPNDPHIDGLTEVMAIAAIASVATAAMTQDDVDFARYNRSALLDGALRDPMLATLFGVGGGFTPEEKQHGKVVPDWMGPTLVRLKLARIITEQDRGEDVTAAPETKRGEKYVIPPEVISSTMLVPLVAPALFGAIETAIVGQRLTGDTGKAGPKDAADVGAALAEGFTGQKLGTYNPATEDYFARRAGDERVKDAITDLGTQAPLRATDEVLKTRTLREALASATAAEEVRRARARLAMKKLLDTQDIGALRAELLRQGRSEAEVLPLSDTQVIALFSATR